MAVDAYCIIKGLNIFKNKTVSMVIVLYLETVQPFPFNQGVECLNASIIIGISCMSVTALYASCGIVISL